jgi:hypothetical protein
MTVTSSAKRAIILFLGILAFVAVSFPIATASIVWVVRDPTLRAKIPTFGAWLHFQFSFSLVLLLHVPWCIAVFLWCRMQNWCVDSEGIEGRFLGRRTFRYRWSEIQLIWIRYGGLLLLSVDGKKRYLAFADGSRIRDLIPKEKRIE